MGIRCPGLFFFLSLNLLTLLSVVGQEKCGLPAYLELQQKLNPKLENKEGFEEWVQEKVKRKRKEGRLQQRAQKILYQLPVVVHVIHQGELPA